MRVRPQRQRSTGRAENTIAVTIKISSNTRIPSELANRRFKADRSACTTIRGNGLRFFKDFAWKSRLAIQKRHRSAALQNVAVVASIPYALAFWSATVLRR